MKLLCLLLGLIPLAAFAAIPLPATPDWRSDDSDYSTGGTWCDVNGNGWLDLVVSNGNDMAHNHNAVYLNLGGSLETNASWRSDDRGMFGHCYSGDVTGNGWSDLAVVSLGPESTHTKLVARLYRNTGLAFEPLPGWKATDRHSSFDCTLGDFDLDGRLDLAVSAGDAYRHERDPARLYRNLGAAFDTLPAWSAAFDTASDAIRFCDIDNDGDLDLFVGHRRQVSMFRNNRGILAESPDWKVRRGIGWVLRLAFGDFDQDGWPDLAVASNSQLGDSNSIRVYRNNNGLLDTVPTFVMLRSNRYSSSVAWGDADGDGYPELAAGGWWEPVVVFGNNSGALSLTPDWSWWPANIQHLVCEAVVWADAGNRHLENQGDEFVGNGTRKLWSLARTPVQFLDSVLVDGERLPVGSYCFDPLAAWFSLSEAPAPGANVACHYRYSPRLDLAVTNWATNSGTRNLLFLNTSPTGSQEEVRAPKLARLEARPNPTAGPVTFHSPDRGAASGLLHIYSSNGRLVRYLAPGTDGWYWDGRDAHGTTISPGSYFARPATESEPAMKLVVAR
ncbi:MAG: FG-GAP-like repeat-containing protein [bacterium]